MYITLGGYIRHRLCLQIPKTTIDEILSSGTKRQLITLARFGTDAIRDMIISQYYDNTYIMHVIAKYGNKSHLNQLKAHINGEVRIVVKERLASKQWDREYRIVERYGRTYDRHSRDTIINDHLRQIRAHITK